METRIVPATGRHLAQMLGRLRQADVDEIAASTGRAPDHALALAFSLSVAPGLCRAVVVDGVAAAMFGAVQGVDGVGIPWLLGTDRFEQIRLFSARHSRGQVRELLAPFKRLENYIDLRNELSRRWLDWCGFKFAPPAPFGVLGLPFQKFWLDKE